MCHYIDRDRSFGSYVNKKAHALSHCVGWLYRTMPGGDLRSIHRAPRKDAKKSCFHFFFLGRVVKFVHIDTFPLFYIGIVNLYYLRTYIERS